MGIMHVAIDMDGTLAAHPKEFRELMKALKLAMHYVTILPGAIEPNNEPYRHTQLAGLGIDDDLYDQLHVCYGSDMEKVGQAKGEFCRDQKVDMIFDDLPGYLKYVRSLSPSTVCCMILA